MVTINEEFPLMKRLLLPHVGPQKDGQWGVTAQTINGRHNNFERIPLTNLQFCWAPEEGIAAIIFDVIGPVRLWKPHTDKNHLRSREIVMILCVFKVKKNFDPTKDELPEPEWFLEYEDGDPIPAKVAFL